MTSRMIVRVTEQRSPGQVRRELSIDGGPTAFFEITGDVLPPPLARHDFTAITTIFLAMREGRPLHVAGPVSRRLLRNLEEFQEAWSLWMPRDYRPVLVSADEEVDDTSDKSAPNGVFAFSGGVDSVSTLIRHLDGHMGRRTVRPVAAVMIHGFDIPLSEETAFETARGAAGAILADLGVPFSVVRTNWRETIRRRWEMEFGSGLMACLHQFAGPATVGVIGSDGDYGRAVLPWGSNAVTNQFLSSGDFEIQTDCAGLTRTERVALISRYPAIAARLRVCWEDARSGRNCGRCEKCMRTNLNFLANGTDPYCFDRRPTSMEILGIRARSAIQIGYFEEIVDSARKHGIDERWVSVLVASIAKNKLLLPARPLWRRATHKGKRIAQRLLSRRLPPLHGSAETAHNPQA